MKLKLISLSPDMMAFNPDQSNINQPLVDYPDGYYYGDLKGDKRHGKGILNLN